MRGLSSLSCLVLSSGLLGRTFAAVFDHTRTDNLAVYWGQDSAYNQKSLAHYCNDTTIDVFPLAFLYAFRGPGGMPIVEFSNICSPSGNRNFPGTNLADCSSMAQDIKTCQAKGKLVTLSLGGATAKVGFSSDSQARSFADTIWGMFLGGSSATRPFGDAILDGIDLDIENGSPAHYAAFVSRIRENAGLTTFNATTFAAHVKNVTENASQNTHPDPKAALVAHPHADPKAALAAPQNEAVVDVMNKNKYYYITAAPQCPYPDAYIGDALNSAPFDAVYVQFYNNYCGLDAPSEYNFATWDKWAKTKSANPGVKVYIGAAGSRDSAGQGYVDAQTLANYAASAQEKYSSFGGVMMWDASTAFTNNRYDRQVKTAMVTSAKKLAAKKAKTA